MEISSQVKDILDMVFKKTATKYSVSRKEVMLCFKLKNIKEYKCEYDGKEVDISEAGIAAQLFKHKINSVIASALLNFADAYKVGKQNINILMQMDSDKTPVLFLRNADAVLKEIELTELIK